MELTRTKYQHEETLEYKIFKDNDIIKEGTFKQTDTSIVIPWNIRKELPSNTNYIITRPETGETKEGFLKYCFAIHAPKFKTPDGNYRIDVSWDYVDFNLEGMIKYSHQTIEEILNPEFQRGHVWTEKQQIEYVEYIMMGGQSGKEVYFNCKGWDDENNKQHPYYCVDGLQRITAVRRFMNNEFPVFNNIYLKDTTGIDMMAHSFSWHIVDFQSYEEILDWYITLNSTGVKHTKEELDRVRELKEKL